MVASIERYRALAKHSQDRLFVAGARQNGCRGSHFGVFLRGLLCFFLDRSGCWFCLFFFVFLLTVSACGCVLTGVSCFDLGGRKHWFSRSLVRLLNRFTVCLFLSVWDEFDGDVKFWDCFCLVFGKCFPLFR